MVHPYRALLLKVIFDSWATKGCTVCEEARHQTKVDMPPDKSTISIYDPVQRYKARAIDAPRRDLFQLPSGNLAEGELAILDTLRNHFSGDSDKGWFQNMHEQWISANDGRSDNSKVIVGNYHEALLLNQNVTIGFIYIDANNTYPPHVHSEEEMFHIIAGHCFTSPGDKANETNRFVKRKPGDLFFTPAGTLHSVRTEEEPVLILWLNWGDYSGGYGF